MNILFVISGSDNRYLDELNCAATKYSQVGMIVYEDELTVEKINKKDINVIVSGGLKKEWFNALKEMGIVTITIGDRIKDDDLSDIVIDCFGVDQRMYFNSMEYSACRNGNSKDLSEIFNIISKLEWDSNYFGFNIAFISCFHLTSSIWMQSLQFIHDNKIRLVEYLCNCHDRRSVCIAENNGFSFVDIRLTFEIDPSKADIDNSNNDGLFIKANETHIKSLREIASGIYKDSRYYFDGNFDNSKVEEFYKGWAEKGVRGEYDDECWCILNGDYITAFCTVKCLSDHMASIGVVGVSESFKGKGYGKMIILSVLKYLNAKKITRVNVVTQGRNYLAQNLYQSCGFKTRSTQLWYHKWMY